jgi:hypothetical protein
MRNREPRVDSQGPAVRVERSDADSHLDNPFYHHRMLSLLTMSQAGQCCWPIQGPRQGPCFGGRFALGMCCTGQRYLLLESGTSTHYR